MRRKLVLTAAISMAVGLVACTKIQSRDLIREGNQLYHDGQWEQAIEKYNASLEFEPDGVTVLWNRAMAAESIVLQLKDSTDQAEVEKRNKFAELALESLDSWNEQREKIGVQDETPECAKPKAAQEEAPATGEEAGEEEGAEEGGDPDLVAYQDHRLAVLGADSRCSDLVEHWRQLHQACPQNEDLYMTIAQTFEDICGKPDEADKWYIKRTEDFPDSSKSWYSLATRRFFPLMPDPESGLPFNAAIDSRTRIEIADEVISLLEKATAIDAKYRDPYVWRSMAYTQKSLAREYIDPPDTPYDSVEAILARRDLMLAWRETKAVCDIEKIPDCPIEVEPLLLFNELDQDGSSWDEKEIALWGNVVNDSVEEIDKAKLIYEFDLAIEYTPATVEGEGEGEGEDPVVEPAEGEEGEEAASATQTKLVRIRYTFLQPYVAEGEEPPDISAEVEAQLEQWKKLKSVSFSGFAVGKGGAITLESKQKQLMGCCPPAPLTPDAEKSDSARLGELRIEITELEAEDEDEDGKKKKKGKGK